MRPSANLRKYSRIVCALFACAVALAGCAMGVDEGDARSDARARTDRQLPEFDTTSPPDDDVQEPAEDSEPVADSEPPPEDTLEPAMDATAPVDVVARPDAVGPDAVVRPDAVAPDVVVGPDAGPDAGTDAGTGCAPLRFPNVTLRTVSAPTAQAPYEDIADTSCFPLPRCFLDVDHLVDDATGRSVDVHVMVADHFELWEFVRTSIEMGYGPYVLVSPALVRTVESIRVMSGRALTIASGYRSPEHQVAVCRSICAGGASCCPSASRPCGCRSRHMWGDAADLSIASSQYTQYGTYSMRAGAPNCLLEAGSFHVDMSPCPVGCPYRF